MRPYYEYSLPAHSLTYFTLLYGSPSARVREHENGLLQPACASSIEFSLWHNSIPLF